MENNHKNGGSLDISVSFNTAPVANQARGTDTKDTRQHKKVCIQKVMNKKEWIQASLSKLMNRKSFYVLQTL